MTTVNVQYSDSEKTKIIAIFSCPQDELLYQNQGEESTDGDLYKAYITELKLAHPAFSAFMPS